MEQKKCPCTGVKVIQQIIEVYIVKVRIIITGGTFDKQYDEIKGELGFKDTHLPKILEYVRCTLPIKLEINQLIDSLDMHMSNRLKILESCRKSPEKRRGPTR